MAQGLISGAERIKGRSDGIDLLRAIFALWVVLGHLVPWARRLQGVDAVPGWLYYFTDTIIDRLTQSSNELNPAVLAFIVLSGYCIHRNGLRVPTDSIAAFSIRRCFRILPVFWLACLLPILTLHFDVLVSAVKTKSIHGIVAADPGCLVAKMTAIPAIVPFFGDCASQANGPLLTVMVEIVLYALYAAFFAFLVWRGREYWIGVLCSAAFAGGVIVAALVALNPSGENAALYNWWQNSSVFGFLPYWWLGAIAVNSAVRAFFNRHFAVTTTILVILTALLVGVWYLYHTSYETAVIAQFRQLALALWMATLIVKVDGVRVSGFNPLPAIGRAGYSVYAFHAPILVCLLIYGVSWPLVFIAVIAVGLIMYFFVERPAMSDGKRVAARFTAKPV